MSTNTQTHRRPPGAPSGSRDAGAEKPGATTWAPGLPGPTAPPAVLPTPEGLHKLLARDLKAESALQTPEPPRSVRSPGQSEQRGGGLGLRRPGLSQVHRGSPCPALGPRSAVARAALVARRGRGLEGPCNPRAAQDPPSCRALERLALPLLTPLSLSVWVRQLSRT